MNDPIRTLQAEREPCISSQQNVTKRVRDPAVSLQRLRYYVTFLQEVLRLVLGSTGWPRVFQECDFRIVTLSPVLP